MKNLESLLNASGLLLAEEAAQALKDGWLSTDFGAANPTELMRIYSIRANHLAGIEGPHAKQLRASTVEFVSRLHEATSATLGLVQGPAEHQYLIALSDAPLRAIGCMKVISKLDVSDPRWDELWSSAV